MLLASIRGIQRRYGSRKSWGIQEKLALTSAWLNQNSVMVVRFEDLIGPQGGGDQARHKETIIRMGQHMGFSISPEEASQIASRFFGKGATFRKGKIGEWRNHFDEETKEVFKQLAGTHLIDLEYERDLNW